MGRNWSKLNSSAGRNRATPSSVRTEHFWTKTYRFNKGDTVIHDTFGRGVVISNSDKNVDVNFEEAGVKKVLGDTVRIINNEGMR